MFIKIWQEQRILYIKIKLNLWYLAEIFLEWEMFQKKVERKSKHKFYAQKLFFPKIMPFIK